MSAIFRAFEFDHNQVCVSIDGKKVDPTSGVFPISKLFADNKCIGGYYIDLTTE
ncbi:hypothetical protein RISK_005377 [Rhodopirellula islandica]|uniref:Uncharacterized protein n=1 Tax=Rhodopirellula islandica TaxID=595434 RepID=A0A0J1B753_RHOIS|nr:hypothetical protein RISK_005377 [Rhodopirellula islandica]